ncbi:MAG: putative DNA binding domain-containing protein [Gammaproteobacteria bacterium]|nr:putative DNA binding domain-containing protein [Gammaproteobacteria bacterium]MDE0283549.1 putative DNA binding domain-containing protein [Gammaproteobacteria bacterium]
MLPSELLTLLNQKEGAKLDFKRDDVRPETMAKEIVAFANMNGGTILVGVENDGLITGIHRENLQAWLMDTVIGRHVHPFVLPDYEEVAVDEYRVAVVKIHQGTGKPYVLRHNDREDIYVRYGDTCQLAGREQQARLFDTGGLLSAEKLPVYGSSLADLDERRYNEYFKRILRHQQTDVQGLLADHSFLVGEHTSLFCSYFAYALFARSPQLRLPQAGLRLTVYEGADKDYSSRFDKIFNLPLMEYRGDLQNNEPVEPPLHGNPQIKEYISREQLEGMTRRRMWDYPEETVRELLINALVHRDWTKQDYVRVVAYSDRLEIVSPGSLPNGMTVEKMKNGVTIQRNPHTTRIFRDYGYVEHQGMGIRQKVIPLMKKHNGTEPDFEATEDYFKVTLWKK